MLHEKVPKWEEIVLTCFQKAQAKASSQFEEKKPCTKQEFSLERMSCILTVLNKDA